MNEPPDVSKERIVSLCGGLVYDFSKKITINSNGPIYLIISRVNSESTLANISPFLIKKVIDSTCNGEVSECKKLRNGSILVKTKNSIQANKLIKLTAMSDKIRINVSEHKSLNFSKGVMYSSDLFGISEEEILKNMSNQKVCEVKKIFRKEKEELKETGLIILTFSQIDLPEFVYMGYEKIYIRPYIPNPMRCNNCLHYGHVQKVCELEKLCHNCGEINHINPESNEECTKENCCVNCKENNITDFKHSAKDTKCPIFLKNKEIQAIRVLEKTSQKNAERIYNKRHLENNKTIASITKPNNTTINRSQLVSYDDPLLKNQSPHKIPTTNNTKDNTNKEPKSIIIDHISQSSKPNQTLTTTTTKILPRKTSNRLKAQLKAKFKANGKISNSKSSKDEGSGDEEDELMEL